MAIWDGFLQRLFYRYPVEGPALDNEFSPIASFYQKQVTVGSQRIKRYKDLCLSGDTKILLLNGTEPTIKDLFDNKTKNFWVFSYDTKNDKYAPGLVYDVVEKEHNYDHMLQITFDNGEVVKCTLNHPFLMKSLEYKKAEDLVIGDSLQPLYLGAKTYQGNEYRVILKDSFCRGKKPVYKMVAENLLTEEMKAANSRCVVDGSKYSVIHHINNNKQDDSPGNLKILTHREHRKLHGDILTKWNKSLEHREKVKADNTLNKWRMANYQLHIEQSRELGKRNVKKIPVGCGPHTRWHKDISFNECPICHELGLSEEEKKQVKIVLRERWEKEISLEERERIAAINRINISKTPSFQESINNLGILKKKYNESPELQIRLNEARNKANEKLKELRKDPEFYSKFRERANKGLTKAHEFLRSNEGRKWRSEKTKEYWEVKNNNKVQGIEKSKESYSTPGNHKIIDIKEIPLEPVFDLRMKEFHNFAIKAGVFVHNSDMSEDTLISAALNIYASEAAIWDTIENSSMWIRSSNPQVKNELTTLFERIELEDYLYGFTRYLCQMGDNFIRPLYNRNDGIVGMEFLDAEMVEREVDDYNRLIGFRVAGGKKLLEPWSIIHGRIMARASSVRHGGSLYGTSTLENARRTYRQLTLLEDALIIYRLELGAQHRVFYIDVGSVTMQQALSTVRQFKREFGKRQYFQPSTGEWTSRFNPLNLTCFTGETKISLLDGRSLSFIDVEKEYGSGEFWVYSCTKDGHIVPGKAHHCRKTGTAKTLIEIELDNGKKVKCTPEHNWMTRDGSYKQAKDLIIGDSLMPLYRKISTKEEHNKDGYEMFMEPASESWKFTHWRVAREAHGYPKDCWDKNRRGGPNKWVLHHGTWNEETSVFTVGNKQDNRPNNLVWMPSREHIIQHGKNWESTLGKWIYTEEARKLASSLMTAYNISEKHRETVRRCHRDKKCGLSKVWNERHDEMRARLHDINSAKAKLYFPEYRKSEKFREVGRWMGKLRGEYSTLMLKQFPKRPRSDWKVLLPFKDWYQDTYQGSYKNHPEYMKSNHKVVAITWLQDTCEDVYDITVDVHHNFALGELDVFVSNSDIWFPVRTGSQSRIEYTGTDANITGLSDIEHFRNKLIAALMIPKSYIGLDDYSSVKYGLSQLDINFARMIKRVQRADIMAFKRLCQIHLAIKGIDPLVSSNDFNIMMSVISSLDQEQRIETMSMALDLATRLRDFGAMLGIDDQQMAQNIATRVLGLTPYDISSIGYSPANTVPGNSTDLTGGMESNDKKLMEQAWNLVLSDPGISREVMKLREASVAEENPYDYTPSNVKLPTKKDIDDGKLEEWLEGEELKKLNEIDEE
jgi:hypothetical protein